MSASPAPPRFLKAAIAIAIVFPVLPALGQGLHVVPVVDLTETWSDNPTLAPTGSERRGWITDVAPGLRIDEHGPLTLFLDSRWHLLRYSSDHSFDDTQRYIDGHATFEAPGKILFLDGNLQVYQQNVNPFGPATTPDRPTAGGNRVETRLAQIAPYVRGYLGDVADYQAKVIASLLKTEDDLLPPTHAYEGDLSLRTARPSAFLGWSARARGLQVHVDGGDTLYDRRLRGALSVQIGRQAHLSASAGYDQTDFLDGGRRSGASPGVGLQWNPSPRARLVALFEHRFYGSFHDVQAAYRTPHTAWRASSVSDLTILPNVLTNGASSPTLQLMNDLLTSAIPDPVERTAAARLRLEEAALGGAAPLSSSFLESRPVEYREDEVSGALVWPRSVLTLRANRREQQARGPALAPSLVGYFDYDFRETRYSVQWAHRLTPLTTFAIEFAHLHTVSLDNDVDRAWQRQATILVRTRLGPHTRFGIGARRVLFSGEGSYLSFSENAVFGLLTLEL